MSEEQNNVALTEPAEKAAPPAPKKKKKKVKGKTIRNVVLGVVAVGALGVGGYFLSKYLGTQAPVESTIQTATADWGAISSSVQGSGSARSKESAAITLNNAGIVQSLFVSEGDMVTEGDPLYEIVSPAAQEAYNAALDQLDRAQKSQKTALDSLEDTQKLYNETLEEQAKATTQRFIQAPFSGQLQEVTRFSVGDNVNKGTTVAKLVDDSKLKASFYFSYAYEGKIALGQNAEVSVPSSAITLTGTVEEINMVRRVSSEGSTLFEVVVAVKNPGALTKGTIVTAQIPGTDGIAMYPYDSSTLDYYRTTEIITKTQGEVEFSLLMDYLDVQKGQNLLVLSEQDFSEELEDRKEAIAAAQEAVKTAEEGVAKAQESVDDAKKALEDFSATAPISGTITYCSLAEGQEVKSGDTVITISNNTTMVVSISVDDRNIAYVKPGMGVDLTSGYSGGGDSFYGVVTKIDMSLSGDSIGSGMTSYPVTLEVDNFDGSLLEGMWLNYSFVTSQSDNCIVVPQQSVKYVGDDTTVVFVQAEERPENTVDIDLPETMPGETPTYPSEDEGYYPVEVKTGINDNYNVEIKEGLEGGETIFVNYYVQQAWG